LTFFFKGCFESCLVEGGRRLSLRDVAFDLVSEVCNKSKVIVKFDHDRLIILVLPLSTDFLLFAIVQISVLAEVRSGNEIRLHRYLPDVFIRKLPLELRVKDLDLVRNRMSTQLLSLKKIDYLRVLAHMEVPDLVVDVGPQARDWLVG
jgi:hypothetical protein